MVNMTNKIKICHLGDYSDNLDEGIKNISYHLSNGYSERILAKQADITKVKTISFWKEIYRYNPDIIHYLAGPSIYSLMISKALKVICDANVIISATHPDLNQFTIHFSRFLKPDLLLTQSNDSECIFKKIGFNVRHLSNGVDLDKFHPVSAEEKNQLKQKYGIASDKFVLLHVGHMIKARRLDLFNEIQNDDIQVVIVVSTHAKIDESIRKSVEDVGCIIFDGYFKNIEEFYQLSDCYVFPVAEGDSILTPLSVLEAMACNLPVIATKFGGLTKMFNEGNGLYLVENPEDIKETVLNLKKNEVEIECRDKVKMYSWNQVRNELEDIYETFTQE